MNFPDNEKCSYAEKQRLHTLPHFPRMLIAVQIKTPEVNRECQQRKGVEKTVEHSLDQVVIVFQEEYSTVLFNYVFFSPHLSKIFNSYTVPFMYEVRIFLHR